MKGRILDTRPYGAMRLNSVARKIVELAFRMGGSLTKYYRAIKCNYRFPDGRTCWDPVRQTHSVDCPVCGGTGAYYADPIEIPAIFIDTRGNIIRDKHGVIYKDTARMVVPPIITPSIVKYNNKGQLVVLRDKFTIYNVDNEIDAIFYIDSEPKDTWLAGTLYYSFDVIVARPNESNVDPVVKDVSPKLTYYRGGEDVSDILNQINEEIMEMSQAKVGSSTDDLVYDASLGQLIDYSQIEKLWTE